jgi:hypothetical protein
LERGKTFEPGPEETAEDPANRLRQGYGGQEAGHHRKTNDRRAKPEKGPAEAGHYLHVINVDTTEGGSRDKVSRFFPVATEKPFDDDTVTAARRSAIN